MNKLFLSVALAVTGAAAFAAPVANLTIAKPDYSVKSDDAEVTATLVRVPKDKMSLTIENRGGAKEIAITGWDSWPHLPRLYLAKDKKGRPKRALPPQDWVLRFKMNAASSAFVTTDYDSDDQKPGPVRTLKAKIDPAKPLLMVPVFAERIPCTEYKCNYGWTIVDVIIGGKNVFSFTADRPDGEKPIFHSPIDLSPWAGQDVTLNRRDCWCENEADSFRGWHFAARSELPADLGNESYRPQFHLTTRWGWSNDPNGLAYYGGKWHAFFQAVPGSTIWRPSNGWGHAVSDDLVTWREELPALSPNAEAACWSGSSVTDAEGVAGYGKNAHIIFYTRHPWDPRIMHYQALAYSTDGKTYHAGPRVIPPTTDGARDPFVFFHKASGKWVLVLNEEPADEFGYTIWNSDNLRDWTKVGYVKGDRKNEHPVPSKSLRRFLSECPWMAEIKVENTSEWLWLVGGGDASYQVGTFNGKSFKPLQEPRVPFPLRIGPETSLAWQKPYYAGQVFNGAPDGRVIYMPWYKMQTPSDARFSQALGLPIEFTLVREKGGLYRLRTLPVRELERLRSGAPVPFEKFSGELVEFAYEADVTKASRVEFDLRGVRLVYDGKTGELTCGDQVKTTWSVTDGRLALRGWLDRCGLEIFAKDGFQVLPDPSALPDPAKKTISVRAQGVSNVKSHAWLLKP